MRAIWLIGINYLREQRLVMLIFIVWIFALSAVIFFVDKRATADDFQEVFQQQAIGCVFYGLLGGIAAIHAERKSRKILAVLARGIYRGEYIAGMLLGNALVIAVYAVCLLLNFAVVLGLEKIPHGSLLPAVGMVWLASVLAAAIALMFGAFLHPSLTSIATSLTLALPWLARTKFGDGALLWIASDQVVQWLLRYNLRSGWQGGWVCANIAILEIGFCWWAATKLFAKRDVTLTLE